MTVIRIFTAVVVVAAIVTITVVLATQTLAADDSCATSGCLLRASVMVGRLPFCRYCGAREEAGDHRAPLDGWPRVPDEQMRIIDAALPKAQAWGRWVQYREAEKQ